MQQGIARQVQAGHRRGRRDRVRARWHVSPHAAGSRGHRPPAPQQKAGRLRRQQGSTLATVRRPSRALRARRSRSRARLGAPRAGTGQLAEAVAQHLPENEEEAAAEEDAPWRGAARAPQRRQILTAQPPRGCAERSLVDDKPGTTRDPVDTRITFGGREFVMVDTAGVRRRARVEQGLELVSVLRSIKAVERANVVVLLRDATEGAAEQDARLLGLAIDRRRAIGRATRSTRCRARRRRGRSRTRGATSTARFALHRRDLRQDRLRGPRASSKVGKAADEMQRRVPTAELNRFFREVLERQPPPTHMNRSPRIYYITQARVSPPLFAVANYPGSASKRATSASSRTRSGSVCSRAVPIKVEYRSVAARRRRREPAPQPSRRSAIAQRREVAHLSRQHRNP